MIWDPEVPPPLPEDIPSDWVRLASGDRIQVVTVGDAAKLIGVKKHTIDQWITDGKITICYAPDRSKRVLVDSLWNACPIEFRVYELV